MRNWHKAILAVLAAAVTVTAYAAAAPADSSVKTSPTLETPAPAQDSGATRQDTVHLLTAGDLEAWLDSLMTFGLKNGDVAGAVVAVVKDGKVLFQSGYGYADVEHQIPMDAERTLVRIGSVSKLFTWTAVMQLVEQGKLDLNRNVDDYLDFKVSPAGGRPITLLDLMNHRGGFEEGLKDVLAIDPARAQGTETYLKQHPRPLLFGPGSVPAYSNYGTAVAGYIVERVSGEAFEQYVEEHIFQPLGMAHSSFRQPLPEQLRATMSNGYRMASGPASPFELVATRPAGSASSTAADMGRFMLAHLQDGRWEGKSILGVDAAQLMHSPSQSALPGFDVMAHGFFYQTRNDRLLIGHGGDTIIFHADLELLPREAVGLFVGFNSRGREDAVYGLRKALVDQFLARYFPPTGKSAEAAVLKSAAADAGRIAGRYQSSRRVEHGFLSTFYLMQQTVIGANVDGTILAPKAFEAGEARYREVAPDVWREEGGSHELALSNVDGIDTVLDSEDPTSVLQRVPVHRASSTYLAIMAVSTVILLLTVFLWPIGYSVRRHYRSALPYPKEAGAWRTLLRVTAALNLVWLAGWAVVLAPVLHVQIEHYGEALDPTIRTLQIAGLIVLLLAVLGLVCFFQLWRSGGTWLQRMGNALIATALLGVVWVGLLGHLIGLDLNY
jgi:CubicO group peptidase (beta-lactamase class C family)